MNKEILDEILDEFDFEKVHKVMVALNWTWHSNDGVPSIGDLRRAARELLNDLVRGEFRCVGTKGFYAYMENGLIGLRFQVTDWEVEIEKGIGQ
jgi:hypothetical protein